MFVQSHCLSAVLRRLQALQYLHTGQVPALILDVDDTHARMIEIEENLQRADLTDRMPHARYFPPVSIRRFVGNGCSANEGAPCV